MKQITKSTLLPIIFLSSFSLPTLGFCDEVLDTEQTYLAEINSISMNYISDRKKPEGKAYFNASDLAVSKYKQIIKKVRNQNTQKVDEKLWQSINVNFNSLIKNCRSSTYTEVDFIAPLMPVSDCEVINYRNFATTTVKLHLGQ